MPDDGLVRLSPYGHGQLAGIELADGFAAELQPPVGILGLHDSSPFIERDDGRPERYYSPTDERLLEPSSNRRA